MLEARATASRAAPIASIKTEHARAITTFQREGCLCKELADFIKRADITGGVGTRGFTDGRLIHKDRIGQPVGSEQSLVCPGRLGGLAKVAQQRRVQHVLHQGAFAGTTHARDTHQVLQREFDGDVFQVVLGRALKNQLRCGGRDESFDAHAHLFARAEVSAGQCVRLADGFGRAVENNLPTAFTGPGAHVNQPVGGQHHGRVVFHHHQGVARITQAVHGFDDAVHVTRMQANAGLVQHEQGIHQRGAQGRGQVDALHLTAAQGAALAVQREVTQAHLAEVTQAGADFIQQQLEGVVEQGAG